jgi:hypothetical protein
VVMLSITGLGLAILAANYIPTIVMMRRVLRGNVPESLPAESYAKVVVAKVVFALLLAMLAGSKPFGPAAPIVALAASLGPGYFIASMVIDLVSIIFLRLSGVLQLIQDSCIQPTLHTLHNTSSSLLWCLCGAGEDCEEGLGRPACQR